MRGEARREELEDWLASVGPAMAGLRKKAGLSQADVAARMKSLRNVGSESSLGKAENSDVVPTTELLFTFLAALDASPRQFVDALEVAAAERASKRDPLQDALVAFIAQARKDPNQRARILALLEGLPEADRSSEVRDAIQELRGENGHGTASS